MHSCISAALGGMGLFRGGRAHVDVVASGERGRSGTVDTRITAVAEEQEGVLGGER